MSDIPSIKPDQDEVASFRRNGRSKAPKQSNFNGLLVFVLLVMAIVMGFGGYTIYEVRERLAHSSDLLAEGRQNIEELEARLAATGTDVSKTLQDINEQVKTNFSEIDKLWAVSHRQNKPDIQKNVRAIAAIKTELGDRITGIERSAGEMSSQYQSILRELSGLREGLLEDNEELVTEIALLRGQVQDQAVVQEANRRNLGTLKSQIRETEEAIESIDKYRNQMTQKMADLENRIRSTGPVQ